MISSCQCMCPGDLTIVQVSWPLSQDHLKKILEKIVIVMTSFINKQCSYIVYILVYHINEHKLLYEYSSIKYICTSVHHIPSLMVIITN